MPAYTLLDDPYFSADANGHLTTHFGDSYALYVQPHDDCHRCYIGSSANGIFAAFTAPDPRDVLALAVAIDNTAHVESGEVLDDGPFDGFEHAGRLIYNSFIDPKTRQWQFVEHTNLRHPSETFGDAYTAWRDALAEERARQIAEWQSPEEAAMRACDLLLDAYARGEQSGSVPWEALDQAHEAALKAKSFAERVDQRRTAGQG